MKNIVLQHFTGKLRDLDKLSISNIKKYAEVIGAEYRFLSGQVFNEQLTPPCQKVYMLNEEFDSYDNVLMLDIDMFTPKGMNENIFDIPGIGIYEPVQKTLHKKIVRQYPELSCPKYPYWGGAIYKMDRQTRQKLRTGFTNDNTWLYNYNKPYHFEDEGIFHTLAVKTKFVTSQPYLDKKWCQCSFLPNPKNAGFIHIRTKIAPNGPKKTKIENYNHLVNMDVL